MWTATARRGGRTTTTVVPAMGIAPAARPALTANPVAPAVTAASPSDLPCSPPRAIAATAERRSPPRKSPAAARRAGLFRWGRSDLSRRGDCPYPCTSPCACRCRGAARHRRHSGRRWDRFCCRRCSSWRTTGSPRPPRLRPPHHPRRRPPRPRSCRPPTAPPPRQPRRPLRRPPRRRSCCHPWRWPHHPPRHRRLRPARRRCCRPRPGRWPCRPPRPPRHRWRYWHPGPGPCRRSPTSRPAPRCPRRGSFVSFRPLPIPFRRYLCRVRLSSLSAKPRKNLSRRTCSRRDDTGLRRAPGRGFFQRNIKNRPHSPPRPAPLMNAPEPAFGLHRLETLPFDNRFARLPALYYTRLAPWTLPSPYLVVASESAAELIGLDPAEFSRPDFAEHFSGNRLPAGAEPLAAVYFGYHFGVWAGQLGDGRAHLLGEVACWEIQLNCSGRTPYNRMGDGRAVLRSSIREFLCSEAMAGLGIPTTRALCLVGSDQAVRREEVETAAVVTRLAPTFVRFGSFEHWAAAGRVEALRRLADYVIDRYRPECRDAPNPYAALLADVSRRTGELLARWQAAGFMHGVMNTDNMSILGLTLDYGPFGFMEAFDAGHVCNHSDTAGRYAFWRQPQVAHWNLYGLGNVLLPLIGESEAVEAAIDGPYAEAYNRDFLALMAAKLGFAAERDGDEDLIAGLYALLQRNRADYPLFFRNLGKLSAAVAEAGRPAADAPVRDHFIDWAACDAWLATWRTRLATERRPDAERQAAMAQVNPKYVLRNWIAEQAIRRAREGDFGEVRRVLACLRDPYDDQPEFEAYASPPPDWAEDLAVSCSS